jgi:hypothetical protein
MLIEKTLKQDSSRCFHEDDEKMVKAKSKSNGNKRSLDMTPLPVKQSIVKVIASVKGGMKNFDDIPCRDDPRRIICW